MKGRWIDEGEWGGGGDSASVIMNNIRCLAELEVCHPGNFTCRWCSCDVLDVIRAFNEHFRTRHADQMKQKKNKETTPTKVYSETVQV